MYLYGLESASVICFMAAGNLENVGGECSQLYVEFGKFSQGLPKRRRNVVGGYMLRLSSMLIALQYHVFMYKETGIIGQLVRDKNVNKVGAADHIHMLVDTICECLAGAYSALVLTPARPIRCLRQIKRLAQDQNRIAAKFTKDDPGSVEAEPGTSDTSTQAGGDN